MDGIPLKIPTLADYRRKGMFNISFPNGSGDDDTIDLAKRLTSTLKPLGLDIRCLKKGNRMILQRSQPMSRKQQLAFSSVLFEWIHDVEARSADDKLGRAP